MATEEKNMQRVKIFLIGLLVLITFFLVNAKQYSYAFLIYIVMGVLSIFFYSQWSKISKEGDLEGIGKDWIKNSFIGLGLAVGSILLGKFIPFFGAIGFPQISASVVGQIGRWVVIVPCASVFEAVFLVDGLTDFFNSKLKLNKWISLVLMAIASSIFHLTAYGNSLAAAGGSFFSAFLIFFLFGVVAEKQNDLSGIIVWHGALNWWNAFLKLAIVL